MVKKEKERREPNAEWLKKDPKLVWLGTWDELLDALAKTHTMSLGDVCNYLKIKRDWVNTHIRHNVPHIFVQGRESKSFDWRFVSNISNSTQDRELIWFNPEELYQFLNENVAAFTRQSIAVSLSQFLSYEQILKLYEFFLAIVRKARARVKDKDGLGLGLGEAIAGLAHAKGGFYDRLRDMLPAPAQALAKNFRADETSRGGIPHVPLKKPEIFGKMKLHAIRHMIGYSGTDESVRRELFRDGFSKVELGIKGKDGKTGRLIFFVDYENRLLAEECVPALEERLNSDKKIADKSWVSSFVDYFCYAGGTFRYDKYRELVEPCFNDLVRVTENGWA